MTSRYLNKSPIGRLGDTEYRQVALFCQMVQEPLIKRKVEGDMKGRDLVNEVLREWESIVKRVARS